MFSKLSLNCVYFSSPISRNIHRLCFIAYREMGKHRQQHSRSKGALTQEEKKERRDAKKDRRRQRWKKDQEMQQGSTGDGRPGSYVLTPKTNLVYEQYYKGQGLIPENEWDAFISKMREPLPCTFRMTGYKRESKELMRVMKADFFDKLTNVEVDGKVNDPPKCLTWYPDGLAWQVNLDRKFIRSSETLKDFHQFLIQETESGNISRQEAVSMIPPLVLDVQPHHKVLDMCAAPGSKTAQLIEMLHADDSMNIPDGVVVANDSDNKRCYLMVHQVKRLESPAFMVINHDATQMPNLRLSPPDADRLDKKVMKFDRVLADVPCSGDGTLRKNVDAWYKWNPIGACHLHNLQARILRRGLEMLAVGGRLVYSTCSLNPLEDEAVIANMLNKTEGSVELVDASDRLPGLKFERGISSWRVMSRDGIWFTSFEEVPESLHTQIRPNIFPPDNAAQLHLDKCMRILPHKQDTGGFFVAVLHKTAELPRLVPKARTEDASSEAPESAKMDDAAENAGVKGGVETDASKPEAAKEGEEVEDEVEETDASKPEDAKEGEEVEDGVEETDASKPEAAKEEEEVKEPPKKRRRRFGFKEDPFVFFDKDDEVWPSIRKYYGISDFPVDQLMVRCNEGKKRNLYFTSRLVKDLLQFNEGRIRFVNSGLKVLARSENRNVDVDFRLVQDGISTLYPFIQKRIVKITKEDIITVLSFENPFTSRLSSSTQDQLRNLDQGSCVFLYTPDGRPDSPQCELVLTAWVGKVSCRSFLAKNDRGHFLRLCGAKLKTKEDVMAEKEAQKRKAENGEEGMDEEMEEVAAEQDVPEDMATDQTADAEDQKEAKVEVDNAVVKTEKSSS